MSLRNLFSGSGRADRGTVEAGKESQSPRVEPTHAPRLEPQLQGRPSSDPAKYLHSAGLLRDLKRFDAAEAVLSDGLRHCPNDLSLAIEYATLAHHRRDWSAALVRWERVTAQSPLHPVACGSVAQALIELERFDEAETRLTQVRVHFPDDYFFAMTSAVIATKQKHWPEALRRWELVRKIKPDSAEALTHIEVVQKFIDCSLPAHGQNDAAHAEHTWVPALIERVDEPGARELLLKFESWGETCEFGLVQRRYQAEPLGLLRWTYVSAGDLATILEARFEDIGNLENISLMRDESGEHWLKDKKFGLQFHLWHTADVPNKDEFVRKHVARIHWLREKLIEDLTEGEKCFVYKRYYLQPTESEIQRIFAAIRSYGPNKFLYVSNAGEGGAAGSLKVDKNGLLRGFTTAPRPDVGWDIAYDDWLSICKQVDAL